MEWAQNATVRSLTTAQEIVKHDVARELFWKWQNFCSWWLIWPSDSQISIIVILVAKAKFSTMASWKEESPNKCDADRQNRYSNVATESGMLMPLVVRHTVSEFQWKIWDCRPRQAQQGDCDSDQQPEMSIWLPKPKFVTTLWLINLVAAGAFCHLLCEFFSVTYVNIFLSVNSENNVIQHRPGSSRILVDSPSKK